jgi:hypothetical protein
MEKLFLSYTYRSHPDRMIAQADAVVGLSGQEDLIPV